MAAGIVKFRVNAQWHNSSGTYLGQTDGVWQDSDELIIERTSNSAYATQRVRGEFTVPTNAVKMTPVIEMQHPNPVNAFAIYDARYEHFVV